MFFSNIPICFCLLKITDDDELEYFQSSIASNHRRWWTEVPPFNHWGTERKRRGKKKTAKYEITRRGWVVEKDKIQSQVIENQVENMDGDQSLDRNAGVLQTV